MFLINSIFIKILQNEFANKNPKSQIQYNAACSQTNRKLIS